MAGERRIGSEGSLEVVQRKSPNALSTSRAALHVCREQATAQQAALPFDTNSADVKADWLDERLAG